MRGFFLGFSIGVSLLLLWRQLPLWYWSVITIIVAVLFSIFFRRSPKINILLAISIGLSWALLCAAWQQQKQLPQILENKDVIVQGMIATIPEYNNGSVRFEFLVKKLQFQQQSYPSPKRIRLNWQVGQLPKLLVGDQWQLIVRLKRPHATFNPGGFDQEEWLFEHKIHATGYVRGQENLLNSRWYHFPIDRLRQYLAAAITKQLNQNPMTGFITAITVGVRDAITPAQWQTLRGTGTNHLMAIAGLHVGLMAAAAFFLFNFIWRLFPRLLLKIPAPQAAAMVALIAAIIYSALAGFSLPTQRASIMLAVFLLAAISRRYLPPWDAVLLALFIILLFEPLAPLSSTFWLSFVTVALIIYGMTGRIGYSKKIWHWGKIQWVISLGLIPVMLLFFQQVSLLGIVANLIAIPWVGFLVLPISFVGVLVLLIAPHWGGVILKFAALLMSWLWPVMEKLAGIHVFQWYAAIPNIAIFIATMCGVLLLLAPRAMPARWLGIIYLLPLLFWHLAAPKPGEVWFTLLDVGQGLASVVRTQNHTLVYDTGPKFSPDFNMGDAVVVPYLRQMGIKNITMMIISHSDEDHSGGANSVLAEMPVQQIYTSATNLFPLPITHPCWQGEHWQWDGVTFTFLSPPVGQPYLDNESSCVLKITTGKNSILLTGDIEKDTEKKLLQNELDLLPATIIVAPHHGSGSSSTQKFVSVVAPNYVLFPTGYLNRWRFPNKKVMARYQQVGAMCYNSAYTGALSFKIKPNLPVAVPISYRECCGHFWN